MDAETLRASSSRSSRPREATRGRGWGSRRCTASSSRTTARSRCRAASDTARRFTFICRVPRTSASRRRWLRGARGGNETILLVEDDDRVRALISNMLRKNGFTVLLASAGDQALEIAARHRGRIHLLLTDMLMPGLNGRMLSERLPPTRPETRVLYMSGYSDDDILRLGVRKRPRTSFRSRSQSMRSSTRSAKRSTRQVMSRLH